MENSVEQKDESVQKEAVLLKQLYFWSFIAFGMIAPFSGIFYKKVLVGPDGEPAMAMIGNVLFWASALGMISNMISSVLSDKFRNGRGIISWLCVLAFFMAILVGSAGSDFLQSWSLGQKYTYLLVSVLLYRFTMMPMNSLLDAETMQFLQKNSDRALYGTYRIWGTIGWAVATFSMGAILNYFDNYQLIFYVGAFGYLVFALLGFRSGKSQTSIQRTKLPWNKLFHDGHFVAFLVFAFIAGLIESTTSQYTGIFFDNVMSPLRIGIIFSVWVTFEIPVMHYSKQLIAKLGVRGIIVLGLIFTSVKLLMFSYFKPETSLWFQILAALIHGPGFGFLFLGMVNMADRLAQDSMKATYMGATNVARYTLASMIGSKLGAALIDMWGGALFMRVGAVSMAVLIPVFLLLVKEKNKKK